MNQEAKKDNGKLRPSLVPTAAVWAIAAVRDYGVKKYADPLNYRTVEPERLRDALCRHLLKYIENPNAVDEESGLPHLWHIMTNGAFLCELETGDRIRTIR